MYGESLPLDQRRELDREQDTQDPTNDDDEDSVRITGRGARPMNGNRGRYADGLDSESESDAQAQQSEKEWSGVEDESDDDEPDADFDDGNDDDDDEISDAGEKDDDEGEDNTHESLVVQLRYRPTAKQVNQSEVASRKGTPLREVMNASGNDSNRSDLEPKDIARLNIKARDPELQQTETNGTSQPNGSVANKVNHSHVNGFDPSTASAPQNGIGMKEPGTQTEAVGAMDLT